MGVGSEIGVGVGDGVGAGAGITTMPFSSRTAPPALSPPHPHKVPASARTITRFHALAGRRVLPSAGVPADQPIPRPIARVEERKRGAIMAEASGPSASRAYA